MIRGCLLLIGALWITTGIVMLLLPQQFYELIPGLSQMGPFNLHFIRDVGLAFIASGGATCWGAWCHARATALAGSAWPALHAIFHIQIWAHRGFPADHIAAFDAVLVVLPAMLAVFAAMKLGARPPQSVVADPAP